MTASSLSTLLVLLSAACVEEAGVHKALGESLLSHECLLALEAANVGKL
jgi:hypothetical protein